jgi:hypothetical protein
MFQTKDRINSFSGQVQVFSDRIGSGRFTQRIGSAVFWTGSGFSDRVGCVRFSKGKEKIEVD